MKSKPEYHPPATQEPTRTRDGKSRKILKPKPKKKTIVIEESESEESEEEIVVKRVRKPKAKQRRAITHEPSTPRPPLAWNQKRKRNKS